MRCGSASSSRPCRSSRRSSTARWRSSGIRPSTAFNSWKEIGDFGREDPRVHEGGQLRAVSDREGLVPESSFDDSFDGSYSRFVADTSLLQQAFVTETPYRLKSEIKQYGRDVGVILVSQSGYDPYLSSLVRQEEPAHRAHVRASRRLVPIIQQAQIDYIKHPTADEQGDGRRRHRHEVVLDAVDAASGVRHTRRRCSSRSSATGSDKTLGNFATSSACRR